MSKSMSAKDAMFETDVRGRLAGLALCAGCEEEWVRIPAPDGLLAAPAYCKWCAAMKKVLEEEYARERRLSRFLDSLPRQNAGVVPIERVATRLPILGRKEVLLACGLYLAPGIAGTGLVLLLLYFAARAVLALAGVRP